MRLNRFGKNFTRGSMGLHKDFKEFIGSLNTHKVKYLVVGGYAVAFHGHPRYTKHLDVWISRDLANLKKLISALDRFGVGSLGYSIKELSLPDTFIQIGVPPVRIDILNSLPGVRFTECYRRRKRKRIDGIEVSFIDLQSLIKNKAAVGRKRDLADIEDLGGQAKR